MHVKPVRYQNQRCLHFITFSCYHRMPLLDQPSAKQTFERELERVRAWYGCYITGYVVMPEHVHLLVSEPERSKLSVVIQMLKQIKSRKLHTKPLPRFWQVRYNDFPVWGAGHNHHCGCPILSRLLRKGGNHGREDHRGWASPPSELSLVSVSHLKGARHFVVLAFLHPILPSAEAPRFYVWIHSRAHHFESAEETACLPGKVRREAIIITHVGRVDQKVQAMNRRKRRALDSCLFPMTATVFRNRAEPFNIEIFGIVAPIVPADAHSSGRIDRNRRLEVVVPGAPGGWPSLS